MNGLRVPMAVLYYECCCADCLPFLLLCVSTPCSLAPPRARCSKQPTHADADADADAAGRRWTPSSTCSCSASPCGCTDRPRACICRCVLYRMCVCVCVCVPACVCVCCSMSMSMSYRCGRVGFIALALSPPPLRSRFLCLSLRPLLGVQTYELDHLPNAGRCLYCNTSLQAIVYLLLFFCMAWPPLLYTPPSV